MTTSEKIKDIEEKIRLSNERIKKEQEKIRKWNTDIETLKTLEIKGLLKEHDVSIDDLQKVLSNIKAGKGIKENE